MSELYESHNDVFNLLPVKIYRHDLEGALIYSPLHWHRSLELTITLTGRIRFNTGSNDFDCMENDWLFVNSRELHSCRYLSSDDHFTGISIIFSYPFVEKWLGKNLIFHNPQNDYLNKEIKEIATVIYNMDTESKDYQYTLMSYVFKLFGLLSTYCIKVADSPVPSIQENSSSTKFSEYIEAHYQEDISFETVAEYFQYAPNYFSKLFKDTLGVTFHTYLSYVRASHAAEQLSSGNTNLTECCFNNGFPNMKSFINTFKKLYGCTPSSFIASLEN